MPYEESTPPNTAAPAAPIPDAGNAPAPAPVQETKTADNAPLNDAFGALDKYLTDEADTGGSTPKKEASEATSTDTTTKPPAQPADAGKPASTTTTPPAAPKAKAQDKTGTASSASEKPSDDLQPEKMAPKQLREAYSKLKAQHRELEERFKKAGEKPAVPADDPEKKSLAERLQQREQELQAYREQIKFANYEQSDEYKDRYYKPFLTAFEAGRNKVASLTLQEGEGTRKGTPQDFDALMGIRDEDAAAEFAEERFGNKAAAVLYHRERVIEANNARIDALEQFKKTIPEREKQAREESERHAGTWHRLNTEAAEKYPQWFKPTDGDDIDPKANELLERGMQLADSAFMPGQRSPEENVRLHSAIRNKAGAFDRVAYELAKSQKRIKALQAELDEIKTSVPEPGSVKRGRDNGKPAELDWESKLDSIATPG